MGDSVSVLAEIDRLCGQLAVALPNAEFQIYATLALIVVLGVLLFPPKNDPTRRKDHSLGGTHRPPREFMARQLEFGVRTMLSLVVTLLIVALIAAILGFGGIAGAAVGIAKIVFFVAIVLFLVSLIAGGMRGSFRRRL